MEKIKVVPGQIWADNDPRAKGRTIEVLSVKDGVATCRTLTNRTVWVAPGVSAVGRTAKIKVSRFRPTKSGYILLGDAKPMPVLFTLPADPEQRVEIKVKFDGDQKPPEGEAQASGSGC